MTDSDPFKDYTAHAVGLDKYRVLEIGVGIVSMLGYSDHDDPELNAKVFHSNPAHLSDGSGGYTPERTIIYLPQTHQGRDDLVVLEITPDILIERLFDRQSKTILLAPGLSPTILEDLETVLKRERTALMNR
jgi:hypothetical protein